jgi:hypothetical protein
MKHRNAILLAIGSILLGGVLDVGGQTLRGMMWTENDWEPVVKMSGEPSCAGYILATNKLTYTDHGIEEGYFAIGNGFSGMMNKENPALHRVRENLGRDVDLVLRVREPRKLEAIGR